MPRTSEVNVALPLLFVSLVPMLAVEATVLPFSVAEETRKVAPERSVAEDALSYFMILKVAYPMFEEELAALS